ncbi:MAG TPA: hypothetical protein VN033_12335 [Vulgatibacter sp.]|nr:hypothetical protein [Vulgatibacter sp.]
MSQKPTHLGVMAWGSLSPKQTAAAAALLTCRTDGEAAAAAGVSLRSIARWKQLPAFQAAMAEARRESLRETVGALQLATGDALAKLRALLEHEQPYIQLQAAQTLLGAGLKVARAEELERRLADVEAKLARRADLTLPPRAG